MESAIIIIVIVIFSAIVHEVMHGYAAERLGDPTARYAGRLTLNPVPHIDLFGSILLPLVFALSPGNFFFGWAKPVPYNPYNLTKAPYWGEAIVAAAGPASNLALAIIFSLLIRLNIFPVANELWFTIVLVNISLMLLNLIPIPPLDGSKILSAILPQPLRQGYEGWRARLEYNPLIGFGIVILFILVAGNIFGTTVYSVSSLLIGSL
jgi:Zn-dependent protease